MLVPCISGWEIGQHTTPKVNVFPEVFLAVKTFQTRQHIENDGQEILVFHASQKKYGNIFNDLSPQNFNAVNVPRVDKNASSLRFKYF